jgi:hypothetical protein
MWYYPEKFPRPEQRGDEEFLSSFDDAKDIDTIAALLRL